jgi:hypothetical protein
MRTQYERVARPFKPVLREPDGLMGVSLFGLKLAMWFCDVTRFKPPCRLSNPHHINACGMRLRTYVASSSFLRKTINSPALGFILCRGAFVRFCARRRGLDGQAMLGRHASS